MRKYQPGSTGRRYRRRFDREHNMRVRRGSLGRKGVTHDAAAVVVIIEGLDGGVPGTGCMRYGLRLSQVCVKSLA